MLACDPIEASGVRAVSVCSPAVEVGWATL